MLEHQLRSSRFPEFSTVLIGKHPAHCRSEVEFFPRRTLSPTRPNLLLKFDFLRCSFQRTYPVRKAYELVPLSPCASPSTAWTVCQLTDTSRNTKAALKCYYGLLSFVGTVFVHSLGLCVNSLTPAGTPRLHPNVITRCIVLWGLSSSTALDCVSTH